MTTVVRIKRKVTEEPADTLLIAQKRFKVEEHDQSPAIGLLRRIGTIKHESEALGKTILEAIRSEQMKPSSIKLHQVDLRAKQHAEHRQSSAAGRMRIVNSFRDITSDSSTSERNKKEKESIADDVLFNVYELIDESTHENTSEPQKKQEICCNGVPMIQETVDAGYVYDVYLADIDDFTERLLDFNFSIEKCSVDPAMVDYREDPEDLMKMEDEDEDSNEEGYWKNDYPDEDEHFEEGNDYYRQYEDDEDEEVLQRVKCFHIGSSGLEEEEAEGSESDDEGATGSARHRRDRELHGPAYARYKSRALRELGENSSDESDDEIGGPDYLE